MTDDSTARQDIRAAIDEGISRIETKIDELVTRLDAKLDELAGRVNPPS